MLGWLSDPAACASCPNRRSRSGSAEKDAGSTLIATSRLSLSSRARYTSPSRPRRAARGFRKDRDGSPRRASRLYSVLDEKSLESRVLPQRIPARVEPEEWDRDP